MKKLLMTIGAAGAFLIALHSLQAQEKFRTLNNISVANDSVVMTLSSETKYHVFKISNPPRLIVEFSNTEHAVKQKEISVNSGSIKRVRSGQFKDEPVKVARVVVDLNTMVEYQLKGNGNEVTLSLIKQSADKKSANKNEVAASPADKTVKKELPAKTPAVVAAAPVSKTVPAVKKEQQKTSAPETKTTAFKNPEKSTSTVEAAQTPQPSPAKSKKKRLARKPARPAGQKTQSSPGVLLASGPVAGKTATPAAAAETPKENQKVTSIEVVAQPVKPEESTSTLKDIGAPPAQNKIEAPALPVTGVPKQPETKQPTVQKPEPAPAAAAPAPASAQKDKTKKPSVEESSSTVPQKMQLPKQPLSLDFEDVDIRDVLRVLSIKSGINIIYGADVEGTLTLHLENVPFDKAFDTILALKGLVSQEQGGNILRIVTPQKINEERAQAVTFTKIFPLNYANGEEVKKNLDSIRTAEGRKGNIAIDARTNSMIITDTPEGLTSAGNIITELDKKPYQVIIEAKLVEVVLTDNFDLGIQWQYASQAYKNNNVSVAIGGTTASTSDSAAGVAAAAGGSVINVTPPGSGGTGISFPADAVNGQIGAISFGILIDNNRLSAILTALSQKGLSKLLSNPRVTTLNNQTAKILIGQKVPFSSTTIGASGTSTTSTQWIDVGIKLEVNPVINVDQRITLKIKPEVSLVTQQTAAGPIIASRQADTTVMIKNNETIVIGGLIREEDRKLGTSVPLLGELPIIGHLFRRDFQTKERSELLVFITPQIIE